MVFLSLPKTASTSVEAALGRYCDLVIRNPPQMKHASYQGFMRHYAPMIRKAAGLARADYDVVAIVREPISWLGSWYRYRQRESLSASAGRPDSKSTLGVSFAEFLEAYLQDSPPPYARINTPYRFVCDEDDRVGVDRLFRYDDLDSFFRYASKRLGENLAPPRAKNVSPIRAYDVPPGLLLRVQEKLAPSIQLYETIGTFQDGRPRLRNNGRARIGATRGRPQGPETRPSA